MRAPAGQLAREAIEALVNADAHLVLCNQGKRPLSAGWQNEANRPTAEQAIAHAAAGGLLAVIPSSINLLAVDIDTDAAGSDLYASMLHRRGLVEKAIGEPLATVPTRSCGGHMLYRAPEGEVGNRKWLYGDIRSTRGYCVVWDAARWLAAMSAAPAVEPVNVNALPSSRNGGHHGPVAIAGAPVGERNDTLNREAFKAVAAAKRDGTVVDLRPHRDAALDAGLPANEVDRTLDSAIAGGIEKGDKPAAPRQRPPAPTMRKLLADDDDTETPDAIVPGLLWDGCVTILTAAPKAGKTTLLAHAVGAAYTGAAFLGERCGGDSSRPLCIWSEMPLGMLRAWVRRHIDNPEAPIYADYMRSVDQIREQVDQLKPQAVIVDSLTAMAAARESNADLWRATDVRILIDGVRAAGSAALIVHHVRKSDGQIRDSSDIAAAADMLVELDAGNRSGAAPDPDVTRRRLTYRGRWDESTRWLDFNPATGRYTAADEPADPQGTGMMPGTAENRLDVAVTKYLKQHEHNGASLQQVARALGRRDATVRSSLKRVADRGADERVGVQTFVDHLSL